MPVRVATAAGDLAREALLSTELATRPDVHLVLRCVDRIELLAAIRGGQLQALILLGTPAWFDRQCASEATNHGVRVVAVTDGDAPLGTSSVLGSAASSDEIVQACSHNEVSADLPAPLPERGATGRLTAVWGPKGAPGRSRIAIELAFALQGEDTGCALIDADPYGGDIVQLLGMAEEIPSLVWAARAAAKGDLDHAAIETNLRAYPLGPVVLPGLPRADLWADVSEFGFEEMIGAFRSIFDHSLCDVGFCIEATQGRVDDGGGRNRMTRAALRTADHVLAVFRGDPLGIKHFMWGFEELERLVDRDRILIVANRVRAGDEREISELFSRHLNKTPCAYIPDRPDLMAEALRRSRPVRGLRSEGNFRPAIDTIAVAVGARLQPRGLLTRLGGRG